MKKLIPILVQAIFVFGGVAGGFWIKSLPSTASVAAAESGDAGAQGTDGAHEKKTRSKKDGHGGGHGKSENSDSGYMKFGRQFIVPVMQQDDVRSLVIMDLNVEAPSNIVESMYAREPKLRDALLGRLLLLSTRGVFNNKLIEQENMDLIRAELLEAAREAVGDDAQDVLILNITRQNV